MRAMNRDTITKKIIEILRSTAKEASAKIDEDSALIEDVGLSSIEMMFALSAMENEFSFKIPEKSFAKYLPSEI